MFHRDKYINCTGFFAGYDRFNLNNIIDVYFQCLLVLLVLVTKIYIRALARIIDSS